MNDGIDENGRNAHPQMPSLSHPPIVGALRAPNDPELKIVLKNIYFTQKYPSGSTEMLFSFKNLAVEVVFPYYSLKGGYSKWFRQVYFWPGRKSF